MASLAEYFAGVTGITKSAQIIDLEMIANKGTITDLDTGEVKEYIASYTRNLYTGEYETRTYVFEGVPVSIADNLPESVTVTEIDSEDGKVLELRVAEGDMGKVIGRQGRIAKEIRTIIKTVAQRTGEKVTVEIVD